jgi:hypothetical protein
MCAVSNVGDGWSQRWQGQSGAGSITSGSTISLVSRYEFDQLKMEVLEMKNQLLAAKKQDEKDGNPDCEMEEKIKILKAVAEAVGVSLDDVFKNHSSDGSAS